MITGSDDKTVKVWDLSSIKSYATLEGHSQAVNSVCVTSDDTQIISSSTDKTIIVWSIDSLSKIYQLTHHNERIFGVKCFEDWIVSVSRDARIGIASLLQKRFEAYLALKPFAVRSKQQKNNLVVYGSLNTVAVWGMNETEILLEGHNSLVEAVCFTSNAEKLVSASRGISKNLIVWDLQQKCVLSYLEGHPNSVFCVDISYDDKNVISGDAKFNVFLWDLCNMKKICEFKGHTRYVYSVKFTKNKKFAASGGVDEKVIVWDIENQVQHAVLSGHDNYIWKVSITNDDKYVVSATFTDGIIVWDIQEKKKMFGFKTLDEANSWLKDNREKKSEFSRFLF